MSPDWAIMLHELPDELARLTEDFSRWAQQTEDIETNEAGVMSLHAKNLASATDQYETVLANFYAPWCAFSKAMLPRITEAQEHLNKLSADGLLTVTIGMGNVNMDQESDLKTKYEISQFPTLLGE